MSKRTRNRLLQPTSAEETHDLGIEDDTPNFPTRAPISYAGVLLGITLVICGVWIFLYPTDMLVTHAGVRNFRSVTEHVTHGTSQFYGVVGVLLGLVMLIFAVYSPRR